MRYTIKHLRQLVEELNESYPLPEPNGYGNYKRFHINQAYGGYRIVELIPGSTGQRDTHSKRGSARQAAEGINRWLMDNQHRVMEFINER